ncbi:MAG TPA: lipid-binding SYLF domain-containing protein [Tepidisphaeraceae bacterium]|jgi:lipid-binding SYLF domain-containing protein|nr:lipid-binding SYLF domain-containing protein [Tepidisphaeraceae bacterium]
MKKAFLCSVLALGISAPLFTGCNTPTTPKTDEAKANLTDDVQACLNRFERDDSGLKTFLDNSTAYVVFPSVGKGGLIAGGAFGRGQVFEKGQLSGYAKLTQASIGLQAGGQEYAELVVFGTPDAFQKFKDQKFEFGANASAVAMKSGAASASSFRDGVAVFTEVKGGFMADLSMTGQKLTYSPTEITE